MTTVDIFHLKFYFKGINDSLRRCQKVFASEREFWCIKAWFPFNTSDREVAASCNISHCWKYFCPFIPAHTQPVLNYLMAWWKVKFYLQTCPKYCYEAGATEPSGSPQWGKEWGMQRGCDERGGREPTGRRAFPPQHINKIHQRLGRSGIQHTPSWSNKTVYSALEFPPSLEVYVSFQ